MYHVGILGTGSYVPDRILTNQDLEKMVQTSDEWIRTRTGIRERRIASEDETNVTMGGVALKRAIENAQIEPAEIEFVVVGTNTTEPVWPSAAGQITELVHLSDHIPFVDVQAGCTGFNYALSVAEQSVKAGQYRTVAVVGTDKLSAITDYEDRNTCVLFGDGAGAVILRRRSHEGIIRSHLGGNWRQRKHLILAKKNGNGMGTIWMDGRKVYVFAKKAMVESCLRVLDPTGAASKRDLRRLVDQVAAIVPHQANLRITHGAAEDLEAYLDLPKGSISRRMIMTIEKYGNSSTSSIPIALDEGLRTHRIKKGDMVILVGFGAGLTYAANLIRL